MTTYIRCVDLQTFLFRDPVHNLCLGAMLMFRKNKEVFISACEAVYWLAADNGITSGHTASKGHCLDVVLALMGRDDIAHYVASPPV